MDLMGDVAIMLVRELEGFQREIALFPDDESVWRTVPGVTNSAGNLALHVAGGLQHFIGHVLGGSAYVRNRETEFGRRSGTRSDVAAEITTAIAVVREVLPRLSVSRLEEMFPEPVMGKPFRTEPVLAPSLCACRLPSRSGWLPPADRDRRRDDQRPDTARSS